MVRSRALLAVAIASFSALLVACPSTSKRAGAGDWNGKISVDGPDVWVPGARITVHAMVYPSPGLGEMMAARGTSAEKLVVLVTAERTFDPDGWLRLPSDESMSTLVTPTGLPIEGGNAGPITERFGYHFHTPVDVLVEHDFTSWPQDFTIPITLPDNSAQSPFPPGLYRLRVDLGVRTKDGGYSDLSGYQLGARPFLPRRGSYLYSGLHPVSSAAYPSGDLKDATRIQARLPFVLLAGYNSNGYSGVVADEDQHHFALSSRNLIQDDVILPLYWNNDRSSQISYSLEPSLPADRIDAQSNIPWDFTQGSLTLAVYQGDTCRTACAEASRVGEVVTAPIVGKTEDGNPTTKDARFTGWRPPGYGPYTVRLTGWIADEAGRRYEGGGTYHFWIANRMTMATATFQGQAYPAKADGTSTYGRDMAFNPPLPAHVVMKTRIYRNSDPADVLEGPTSDGTATAGGIFGAGQGMKALVLSTPGEYWAHVLATGVDKDGHLWVSSMRHAGVLYPPDTGMEAHGKKIDIEGQGYQARGETHREGWASSSEYESAHLEHLTFPWNQHDVLLIASDGGGANKIEPVLYWTPKGDDRFDSQYGGVGNSNLEIQTSSGLSPHLFPEFITDRAYFYASAARPGFMPRFLVGESNVRAPYWSTSPNYFGGQIAASSNGDLVGDLYRLIGGAVRFKPETHQPEYAGYLASAALLPKGTKNNRIVAPGAEDLSSAVGDQNRFFLVGYRPGMGVVQGAAWKPAVQIDPHVGATIHVELQSPAGTVAQVWEGKGVGGTYSPSAADAYPATAYALSTPGVWKYTLVGTWTDDVPGSATLGRTFTSTMPGLIGNTGEFYVFSPDCSATVTSGCRPAGDPGLTFDLPPVSYVQVNQATVIRGHSSRRSGNVRYAIIMPGAVLAQGDAPVDASGGFTVTVSPTALHAVAPIFDIASVTDLRPLLPGRVLHISFLSEETAANGTVYWDFKRLVLRGADLISAPRNPNGDPGYTGGHPPWIPR